MPDLPAHASPAFNPIYSPQAQSPSRQSFDFNLSHDGPLHAGRDVLPHSNAPEPPPSLISPAFTPPSTSGASTPNPIPRSVPVDTSSTSDTPPPHLLDTLPIVNCEVRARIPTVAGQEMFLHVYSNNVDKKEHLAIVFGNSIRSKSLDAERPGETEFARMTRGAYVGRLYPGRTTSRVDQIRQEEGVAPRKGDSPPPRNLTASISSNGSLPASSPNDAASKRTPGGSAVLPIDPESVPPLIRIHSECYTGETVWSARCDCGEQLEEAARLMALDSVSPSGGAIIYLRQEGRGIGLSEKLKAYNLQDLGNDTYEANLLLRHPADARSYGLATAMLMDLGLGGERGIRLLTNNPDKIRAVEGPNREVVVKERVAMVPLAWKTNGKLGIMSEEVEKYLSTKIEKFKHLLDAR